MKLVYNKNPNQVEFHHDLVSKQLLLTSGFGGGKSYALCMKAMLLSYINRPYVGGLFAPSMPEYKKDLLPIMEEILIANGVNYTYHQTDKWFKFPWTTGKLLVFTCEKRVRGPNLAYACVNEPGLITHQRYKEIIGRVRLKVKVGQINLAGTPEGRSNWLYEHFVKDGKGRVLYGHTRHNAKNLADDYEDNLRENYDSIMLEGYLEGKFVNLNGNMFYYAFTRDKNCDTTIKYNAQHPVEISADFNVDYMTSTFWQSDDKRAHAFGELVLPKNQDTNKMCLGWKARGFTPDKVACVYPDPAGNSRDTRGLLTDMTIIKKHGYMVKYKAKAPRLRTRQLAMNNMIDKGLLKLNPNTCPSLLRDFEDVEQDSADYTKIKTNPKLTHSSDGADLYIDLKFPISGTKPITTTGRF